MGNYDGKWTDRALLDKANGLFGRSVLDRVVAESAIDVLGKMNAYDSGFEAGVESTEAGLGRAEG